MRPRVQKHYALLLIVILRPECSGSPIPDNPSRLYSIVCIVFVCRTMVCKWGSYFPMQTIPELFGVAVRKRRQQLRLSQEDFADRVGIHRTYVSSIELGKVQVGIGIAYKLAKTLEIPLSKLFREIERSLPEGESGSD